MATDIQAINLKLRPPIVVILGHVDHGKTTLLDAIRKTKVAQKEAGGITQNIGASVVTLKQGKRITFIDTPGHAAFSNMRSQGTKVADIAILVVASDDGVQPQTKEALEYIISQKIPFIVAATKIDLTTASTERVKSQLEKEGVLFEGYGGDIPLIGVSAKTGEGVDDLLEMILLISELNEIKGDPMGSFEGVVIETGQEKGGPIASVVVRNGTLKVRDEIITSTSYARLKGLFDSEGNRINKVGPSDPAQVLGFSKLPIVGEKIWVKKDKIIEPQISKVRPIQRKLEKDEIAIIVKARNAGSLEAIKSNLPDKIFVIDSGVGDVTESDVFMAKSSNAKICSFEVSISSGVKRLASTEGVEIKNYNIIYKLFEDLEELLKSGKVEVLGKAKILKIFSHNNKKIAGCKVIEGRILKNDKLILKRGDKELGEVRITSLKKEKEDIDQAKRGEECGILITPQLEFGEEDVLISVRVS